MPQYSPCRCGRFSAEADAGTIFAELEPSVAERMLSSGAAEKMKRGAAELQMNKRRLVGNRWICRFLENKRKRIEGGLSWITDWVKIVAAKEI